MSKQRAWQNLVAAGTNALCEAGLSLAYADVSDEQKLWVQQKRNTPASLHLKSKEYPVLRRQSLLEWERNVYGCGTLQDCPI